MEWLVGRISTWFIAERMPDAPPRKRPLQPFTPAGVARFAHAPLLKVLGIAFIFACMAGGAVVWLAGRCWAPVISEAVEALPTNSVIEAGQFFWPEKMPRLLAANEFLAIEAAPPREQFESKTSDVCFLIESYGVRAGSFFGYTFVPYPQRWVLQFNRDALVPLWGAWQKPILFGSGVGTAILLMLSWTALALLYAFYPWLVAALFKRDLTWGSAWKLCYGAMLPGCVLMTFGLLLYLFGKVSLLFFMLMFAAHLIVGWLYIFLAAFCLRKAPVPGENPFRPGEKRRKSTKNPFKGNEPED